MKYLTYDLETFQIYHMNSNPDNGEVLKRFELEQIENPYWKDLKKFRLENPDAEEVIGRIEVDNLTFTEDEKEVKVVDRVNELLQGYSIQDRDKRLKELIFNPETNEISVIEGAELTRLKEEKIALFRELAQQEILDLYPIWKQSNINNLLFGATQEEKDEMNTVIETIINKCNELETTALVKKKKETLEQIIW